MKKEWYGSMICLGALVFLSSCTPLDSGNDKGGGSGGGGGGGGGGGNTAVPQECDPIAMQWVEPSLVSPGDGSIISSLSPMFEWAFPGYSLSDQQDKTLCSTSMFQIYLSSAPFFQDELGGMTAGIPPFDGLYTRTWTPATPLEPGTEYQWSVRPLYNGVEGVSSEFRTFFTGPLCEFNSLQNPIPLSPPNHWVADDLGDLALTWAYPGECLPDGYAVYISNIFTLDGGPLNTVFDAPYTRYEVGAQLEDCQRYYWFVRPIKSGSEGPISQIYTFKVDLTGSCPEESSASLQGTVWEDQCAAPDQGSPLPDTPPLGCVYPAPGSIFPNQTYDPGEPGIPGLVVKLAEGACPSDVIQRDASTWQDGSYDFYELNPGTYCLMVESQGFINGYALTPGQWVAPQSAVGNPTASQTVTVSAGQEARGVDFGWWYHYGNPWGSTDGSVVGMVWHDLCAYSPGDPVPDPLPQGCALDQWGNVHADATRQENEPGIAGVVVDIGNGDCPSAGLATAVTDQNGYYHFNDLTPGNYCLRIDPEDGGTNQGILMPGSWTVLPSGHEGMTFRAITVPGNHTLVGQEFGWDYDNLPMEANITLNKNAYCLNGPDILYGSIKSLLAGETFLITGKSEDGQWYYINYKDLYHCWLHSSNGTTRGDLAKLRIFYGPPLPTPTAVPLSCSTYTDPKSCMNNSACKWVFSAVGPGYCTSK